MRTYLQRAAAIAALVAAGAAASRDAISLDGVWDFALDPDDAGRAQWLSNTPFGDRIAVPGAWDAQGFGAETDKLFHNFVGAAWYYRRVAIPAAWAGRHIVLCVDGVHRSARAWVNGKFLGEHVGYLSPWELDLTPHVAAGTVARIAIRVDSRQDWEVDCLTGCLDIIDAMFTTWGGIWGHVRLEGREENWLEDFVVRPKFSDGTIRARAALRGDASHADNVRLAILEGAGGQVAMERTLPLKEVRTNEGDVEIACTLASPRPWSPETPQLYTARLELREGEKVRDARTTRFGFRDIEIRGPHFYLNGNKIFLRGYGDDCVYPETMVAPSDTDVYRRRLRFARGLGFTFVRHHSHFLPPEYYDAADEVGILVSPELPIAYLEYYARAKGPALELYAREWAAVISRLRNHPSIFDWCMGNEMWDSVPIASDLYRIAKQLDPTRPVVDSDGLWPAGFLDGARDRPTLDFYFVLFDEWNLPPDAPAKHRFQGTPKKPVISHETGNYATFPRLAQARAFTHNVKPFWLTPVGAKLAAQGLADEAQRWAENSERLYLLAHKLNLEDMRKNPLISGYEWWLLQDYWTGSNGIVDVYFTPKGAIADAVRQFNDDVVILLDGLAPVYAGGQAIVLKLLVSHYAAHTLAPATLRYVVRIGEKPLLEAATTVDALPQGSVTPLANATFALGEVVEPQRLTLKATLTSGDKTWSNVWDAWVYPPEPPARVLALPIYATPDLLKPLARQGARPVPRERPLPARAVYVATQPTEAMAAAAASGACLLCLGPRGIFPAVMNRFKPAWWLGSAEDSNVGTVVYDHPATRHMAPEGWCDLSWRRLLEGAQAYVLDDFPRQPGVLVRALDVHSVCRSKALLFEARLAKGSLIVAGLNIGAGAPVDAPEVAWLRARLLEYAATLPTPAAELPEAFLRERVAATPAPEGPFFDGFARLRSADAETDTYPSYREDAATLHVCRQTEMGRELQWESAPLPRDFAAERATFVFAGGLGWRSQPATGGFALCIDDAPALDFDITRDYTAWRGKERGATLIFTPMKLLPEDALGLFYITIERAALAPGRPCRFAVRSKGSGSRRWFALNPYTHLADAPGAGD